MKPSILVIKHGALGDFIFALGAFKAIRDHHSRAHLVLLTTPILKDFAERTKLFDEIILDKRVSFFRHCIDNVQLLRELTSRKFDRIYDLQRSNRTKWYFRIMKKVLRAPADWNAIYEGARYFYPLKTKYDQHILEMNAGQLKAAGIINVPQPSFDWVADRKLPYTLPSTYFLFVPGCSPTQLHKRWPAEFYGMVATRLVAEGITPVVVGGPDTTEIGEQIQKDCPETINLAGKTLLFDLPLLGRKAIGALGHDTGPMHMIYFSGCPSLFLFSYSSGPHLCGPTDGRSRVIQSPNLADLDVETVWDVVKGLVRR